MPTITNASSFTVIVRASKVGYMTKSNTQTIRVDKANGSLSLSSYSGTIDYPNSISFTASGTGSISAWSSNNGVATVSVSGNTITVKSVGAGSATITVKSASNVNYNEKTVTYTVTVKDPTFTGDSGVGYYADTDGDGIPDGIIFADRKKGATGTWGSYSINSYSISKISSTKSYKVSQQNYNGPFGKKDVLVANGSGNERFYVMALSDYNNGTEFKSRDAKKITSGNWSTAAKELWCAFADQLGITYSNYSGYGLKSIYWTSTYGDGYSIDSDDLCYIDFDYGKIKGGGFITTPMFPVRLARTF